MYMTMRLPTVSTKTVYACMDGWKDARTLVCVCVCLFLHTLLSPGAPNLQELQIRIFLDGSSRIAGAGA